MTDLKIAFLADFHYGFPEDRNMKKYLEPAVERMVADINDASPDIVVALGDFIQHSEKKTDLERLERVGEMLAELEPELYAIIGNHDPMTVSKNQVLERIDAENNEPYFSVEKDDRKLIFLDTIKKIDDLYGAGMLGSEQRDWLKDEMDTEKEVLVFSHHLLHHQNLDGNWYFDQRPELAACIDKKDFQEIARDQPRAVFSAHIHEAGLTEFNRVPYFTTTGMDKYNPPETFKTNHAFAEITEDNIVFRTRGQEFEHR